MESRSNPELMVKESPCPLESLPMARHYHLEDSIPLEPMEQQSSPEKLLMAAIYLLLLSTP
jgi:hypothetical protein